MKVLILFSGLLFANFYFGQTWILEKELLLKNSANNWTSDEWGQLYQWKDNTVWLLQNQNNIPFQETYKTFGEITSLQPINGLRALIFTESQQLLGILDNTLQLKEGSLAFYDLNFSNVTKVSASVRPDFIWIFDQYRERLILFQINTAQAQQIVDNCFDGIGEQHILAFFEHQQNLICQLSDGRYYEFDRNLTLVKKQTLAPMLLFSFQNDLWGLHNNQIQKLNQNTTANAIELPLVGYNQLQVLQDRFYFQQGQKISVYRLKM